MTQEFDRLLTYKLDAEKVGACVRAFIVSFLFWVSLVILHQIFLLSVSVETSTKTAIIDE